MALPIVYEHVSPHAREMWNVVWEEIKPQISWTLSATLNIWRQSLDARKWIYAVVSQIICSLLIAAVFYVIEFSLDHLRLFLFHSD